MLRWPLRLLGSATATVGGLAVFLACERPSTSAAEQSGQKATRSTTLSQESARDLTSPGDSNRGEQIRAALEGVLLDRSVADLDPLAVEAAGGPSETASEQAAAEAANAELARDWPSAVRLRTQSLLRSPEPARRFESLGSALLQSRFPELAIPVLRRGLELDSSLRNARFRLGVACQQLGLLDEARTQWSESVRRYPDDGHAHAKLAVVSFYLQDDLAAWTHVHAAESLGRTVPTHFRANLAERTPDPR